MTSIRLSKEVESRLDKLSQITHRPKSFYIKEAINHYLEDFEDGYLALERISNPKRELLTTEEILRELDDKI